MTGASLSIICITAVCQHWRNLALNDCSLWKCWEVPHFTAGALSLAREVFHRSDPIPFRLHLLYNDKCTGTNREMAMGELAALLENAPDRVQALYIQNTSGSGFLEPSARSLPNLSSLHLEDTGFDTLGSNVITRYLDKSHSPNLRRLSSRYRAIPEIPIGTLTHLSLVYPMTQPGLEEFLDFLGGAPLLEMLHLHQAGPVIEEPLPEANMRQVPLNSLHSFAMREYESEGYPLQLLHHLHTPSLAITCWDPDFTNTWVERSRIADEMAQWAIPPSRLLQDLTRMIIRKGSADAYELREDTIHLEAMDYGEYSLPSWLPRFLPKVRSLIITWGNIINNCGRMLGAFSTLAILKCHLERASVSLFQNLEREDDPWLPNITQLILWHQPLVDEVDPSHGVEDALAELRKFSEDLVKALSTSKIAVRKRNGGTTSTFTVRLELGNIDHWESHSAVLRSLLPE